MPVTRGVLDSWFSRSSCNSAAQLHLALGPSHALGVRLLLDAAPRLFHPSHSRHTTSGILNRELSHRASSTPV